MIPVPVEDFPGSKHQSHAYVSLNLFHKGTVNLVVMTEEFKLFSQSIIQKERFYTTEIGTNTMNIGERKVEGVVRWFYLLTEKLIHEKIILISLEKKNKIIITVSSSAKFSTFFVTNNWEREIGI